MGFKKSPKNVNLLLIKKKGFIGKSIKTIEKPLSSLDLLNSSNNKFYNHQGCLLITDFKAERLKALVFSDSDSMVLS